MSSPGSDISFGFLKDLLTTKAAGVQSHLNKIKDKGSAISIAEMFEMQMLMNNLSQLSEMSTSVMSSMNSSISAMARNVKS